MAFLIGFFVSGTIFFALNKIFPYHGMGEYDEIDIYGTFTAAEAARRGVVPTSDAEVLEGMHSDEEGKTFTTEAVIEKNL